MLNHLISRVLASALLVLLSACDTAIEPPLKTTAPKVPPSTEQATTVYWATPGLAPLFILKGPFKHQGMGDEIFAALQDKLPELQHINTEANYPRILTEMRKGTNMCAILHHSVERTEFIHFSNPILITPSYQLYVSKRGKKALKAIFKRNVKAESFDTLLANSRELTMEVTPKQSYGPHRDAILKKYADTVNFTYNFTEQSTLMKRLAADRIDMVLAFPWVFNYELDLLGLHADISKIQLTDMPTHQVSNIGCAKTALGKQVVEAINNITPSPHALLETLVLDWLTPEEINDYQESYKEYFEGSGLVH